MKIKLISLLIALLCVSVLFVSCSDECTTHLDADGDGICDTEGCEDVVQIPEPEEPNCTNHVDENRDGLCDTENCGVVIITNTIENEVEVVIPIAKEEYVPMVVKPIPADAVLSDYVNLTYENDILTMYVHTYSPAWTAENVSVVYEFGYGDIGYILKTVKEIAAVADDPATTDVDESKPAQKAATYTYVDDIRKITVELLTTAPYDFTLVPDDPTTLENEYYYSDEEPEFEFYDWDNFYSIRISGEGYYIFTANFTKVNDKAIELEYSSAVYNYYTYGNNNTIRFTIDGTVYVVNEEGDIIYSEDAIFFLDRPEFIYANDSVGIVYDYSSEAISVFDLTKWFECSYSYSFNQSCYDYNWFVLQNGNILVQYETQLPAAAVNYDFVSGGYKYDLDFVIVDPVAKTATEVEFGYYIDDVEANTGDEYYLTDKLENIFEVYTIENGYLSDEKYLAVNNTLDIACDLSAVGGEGEVVAAGMIVKGFYYNGEWYTAVYDTNGKFLNYLPDSYNEFDDCIILGEKGVYTYDLKPKLDLTKYEVYHNSGSYMILKETVKKIVGEGDDAEEEITYNYYYWNTSLEAPKHLFSNLDSAVVSTYITSCGDSYFIINVPVYRTNEGQQPEWTGNYTQSIYANDCTLICKDVVNYNYDIDVCYVDGDFYILVETWKTIEEEGKDPVTVYQYYMVNTTAPASAPAA